MLRTTSTGGCCPTARMHQDVRRAAITSLASAARRRRWRSSRCAVPSKRALDIGTGCGVQALHLTRHATRVTATDSVPRALQLAATGFAVSGVDVELVRGNFAEPV